METNSHAAGAIAESWERYRVVRLPSLLARAPDIEPAVRHAYYVGALTVLRSLYANAENIHVIETEICGFLNELLRREGL